MPGSMFAMSINGRDLKERRSAIGATIEELARAAEIDAGIVEQWERFGLTIDGDEAARLRWALWWLDSQKLIRDAGLDACEWLTDYERRDVQPTAEDAQLHIAQCAVCQARVKLLEERAPAMPGAIGLLERIGRLPGVVSSAVFGILIVMLGTGLPILILVGRAILELNFQLLGLPAALLAFTILSGAAGGVSHFLTASLRTRGKAGHYASWILVMYGFLAGTLASVEAVARMFGEAALGDDADLLEIARTPSGWVIFLVAGAVAGLAAAHGARKSDDVPPADESKARRWMIWLRYGLPLLSLGAVLLGNALPDSQPERTEDEYRREVTEIKEKAAANPDDADAQYEFGRAMIAIGKFDKSIPPLQAAVAMDSANAAFRNAYGWGLAQVGRLDEAVAQYRAAVRLEPDYDMAQINLAWTLNKLERFREAVPEYEAAIRLVPGQPALWREYAWTLCSADRIDDCVVAARNAVRLDPSNAWAQTFLAAALLRSDKPREALEPAKLGVQLDPKPSFNHETLARAMMVHERMKDALLHYRHAAERSDHPGMWLQTGRLAHQLKLYETADSAFRRVLAAHPDFLDDEPEDRLIWQETQRALKKR